MCAWGSEASVRFGKLFGHAVLLTWLALLVGLWYTRRAESIIPAWVGSLKFMTNASCTYTTSLETLLWRARRHSGLAIQFFNISNCPSKMIEIHSSSSSSSSEHIIYIYSLCLLSHVKKRNANDFLKLFVNRRTTVQVPPARLRPSFHPTVQSAAALEEPRRTGRTCQKSALPLQHMRQRLRHRVESTHPHVQGQSCMYQIRRPFWFLRQKKKEKFKKSSKIQTKLLRYCTSHHLLSFSLQTQTVSKYCNSFSPQLIFQIALAGGTLWRPNFYDKIKVPSASVQLN